MGSPTYDFHPFSGFCCLLSVSLCRCCLVLHFTKKLITSHPHHWPGARETHLPLYNANLLRNSKMTSVFNEPGTTATPLNPFLQPILTYLVSSADCPDVGTPEHLVATVTSSPDPLNALWQLWDAFFTTVLCADPLPLRYVPHLAFLKALSAHPPTEPKNVPAGSYAARHLRWYTQADGKFHWSTELPRFHALWRDAHDSLEGWRRLKATASSAEAVAVTTTLSNSNGGALPDHAQCYLRFCAFSAALLKASEKRCVKGQPMQVFFACLRVLEHERPGGQEHAGPYRISSEQVWASDICAAATWMQDGGPSLWNADEQKLRETWAAALDEPTELYQREDGLTRDRWQLWAKRFQELSTDNQGLIAETRAMVSGAAEVVKNLLSGT